MRRREFITLLGGAAAAWPLAARAQQPDRIRRIAVLSPLGEDDPEMTARLAGFRQGLKKRGWSEGRNVSIDIRFAPLSSEDQARVVAKGERYSFRIVQRGPPEGWIIPRGICRACRACVERNN